MLCVHVRTFVHVRAIVRAFMCVCVQLACIFLSLFPVLEQKLVGGGGGEWLQADWVT